ncbi:type IV pilus assembly protein PilX [Alteromonadaceae bacterium 2753L.S.0a.02]|nr:type IV pilus assembly protein PilX [Alteromonadaceae bacterium 2753L.S.0a.02]
MLDCLGAKQNGATLAVTLVLLLIVSVLGISAVQMSLVEEKMSGNLRDKHIAFEAAETALIRAEATLDEILEYSTPTYDGSSGIWIYGGPGGINWWIANSDSWWVANSESVVPNSLQSSAPQYIVEERAVSQRGEDLKVGNGEIPQARYYYQITARGYGGSSDTRVHLRTTYIKRYD